MTECMEGDGQGGRGVSSESLNSYVITSYYCY